MAQDWQPEIRLAVEIIFPTWLLLECLKEFAVERPETRIELYETVLTGTGELLAEGRVDLAIGTREAGARAARVRYVWNPAAERTGREDSPERISTKRRAASGCTAVAVTTAV